jgi:phenylalanyl-tRNA synthetase beta chain
VFLRDASVQSTDTTVQGFDQPMRLAGLATGSAEPLAWGSQERSVDFFDIKGDIEALLAPAKPEFVPSAHPAMHPGRCAQVVLDGVAIGFVGELHPKWRQSYDLSQAPIFFEVALDAVLSRHVPCFNSVSKFQSVERDIAVMVDDKVTHEALIRAIWDAPTVGLLRDAVLFDIYRPKTTKIDEYRSECGEKSMAVRLTLNAEEATLSEERIDATVAAVVTSLVNQVGARQRA